jgi:glycosyltransferase involved in cell wall biosynthesis
MNILQFTLPHHPSMGGIYTAHEDFRTALNAPIVEVVPSSLWHQTKGDYQIKLLSIGFLGKFNIPMNIPEILSNLSTLKVDIVIIHSLFHIHSLVAYWYAKQKGIPYLFVPHGTLDPYVFSYNKIQKKLWMKMIGQTLIDHSHAVICSTSREAEKASKYLKSANIEICPWGIREPDTTNNSLWKEEIKKKLNIPSEKRILIFLGRISQIKRILETANAFKQLSPQGWTLLIVGYPEELSISQSIQSISDGELICYHPPVDSYEKWKFLTAADAFINLSYKENFGYAVAEAALVGLPILISDGVDIYPMLQSAGAADVISIDSETEIISGINMFLTKPLSELKIMGMKAKQVALNNFTYNSFNSKLHSIVEKYVNY